MSPQLPSLSIQDLQQVVPEPLDLMLPSSDPQNPPKRKTSKLVVSIMRALTKAQKYSAYGFLGFFGLHIASTMVAPGLGIRAETCQDFFEMCRNVYLGPLFEYLAIYATGGIHVLSGVALRVFRTVTGKPVRKQPRDIVIRDSNRDDIGLGGLGTLLGLGFKRSWISTTFPAFTPLTFSGYVMAASLGFHWFKMRLLPLLVDGDSSLITLRYVTHYLHQSAWGKWGAAINLVMLGLLLWVSFYHIVSGLFKYRRQVSARAKKIAYGVIGTFTMLSAVAIFRMKLWSLDTGFMGRKYAQYLRLR